MLLHMLAMRSAKHKVFVAVVLLVTVSVMDLFSFAQAAPDVRLHHDDVFANVAIAVGAFVFGSEHESIAVLHDERLAMEISAARLGAEARTTGTTRPNGDGRSALSAGRLLGLNSAHHRAEMVRSVQFTRRPIERESACGARNVRDQRSTTSGLYRSQLLFGCAAMSRQVAHGVETSLVTKDALQFETRRREIDGLLARSAMANHQKTIVLQVGGRWQQKDMGHFEYAEHKTDPPRTA